MRALICASRRSNTAVFIVGLRLETVCIDSSKDDSSTDNGDRAFFFAFDDAGSFAWFIGFLLLWVFSLNCLYWGMNTADKLQESSLPRGPTHFDRLIERLHRMGITGNLLVGVGLVLLGAYTALSNHIIVLVKAAPHGSAGLAAQLAGAVQVAAGAGMVALRHRLTGDAYVLSYLVFAVLVPLAALHLGRL